MGFFLEFWPDQLRTDEAKWAMSPGWADTADRKAIPKPDSDLNVEPWSPQSLALPDILILTR